MPRRVHALSLQQSIMERRSSLILTAAPSATHSPSSFRCSSMPGSTLFRLVTRMGVALLRGWTELLLLLLWALRDWVGCSQSRIHGVRLRQVTLVNRATTQTLLNSFTIAPDTGNHGCRASVLLPMPLPGGQMFPSSTRPVEVPISFVPVRKERYLFGARVFSADNGSGVGTLAVSNETNNL